MRPGILAVVLASCSLAFAQQAVDIATEPHYSVLLENDQVRVLALTLLNGESVFARYHHSFLSIPLQDGEIVMWDEGKSPIQHFQVHQGETSFVFLTPDQQVKGVSGGILNDRPNDYRNVTVEFLDPNIGWNILSSGYVKASMFLGGAIVADVTLQPGEPYPAPEKRGAELLIPVSDVHLKTPGGIHFREAPGEVTWIEANRISALANAGREAARFIVVEFRPDDR